MNDIRLRKTLATNLRREMDARELTQPALAEISGEPTMNINRILNEKNTPKVGTVQRIAEALGLTVDALLRPSRKKTRQPA